MLSEAGIDASKVSVLDKGEMVKTEGEIWPWVIRAAIFIATALISGSNRQGSGN